MHKVRGAEEDLKIVSLLLGNIALALDAGGSPDLGALFQQFGSSLRKLQVAPSGGINGVRPKLLPYTNFYLEVYTP